MTAIFLFYVCLSVTSDLFRLRIVNAEGLNGDCLHHLRHNGSVSIVGVTLCNGIDGVHTLDDLAEGGICTVKVRRCLMHDEELGSGRIGYHCARH